jgi:DNA repair protein RecO (recombination protein O)
MAEQLEGSFLILRKIKYGEADLIIHALSSSGEKMSFLARGALKSKKRFGGGILEPTHHVKFFYSTHSQSEIHPIKEAILIHGFEHLRKNYDFLTFALTALDVVGKVSLEGDQESAALYNLVGHLLKCLDQLENLEILRAQFYLKFLMQQGVLEIEDWMKPFLSKNLNESHELLPFVDSAKEKSQFLERRVKAYVETASLA